MPGPAAPPALVEPGRVGSGTGAVVLFRLYLGSGAGARGVWEGWILAPSRAVRAGLRLVNSDRRTHDHIALPGVNSWNLALREERQRRHSSQCDNPRLWISPPASSRSEEHTSELQSL